MNRGTTAIEPVRFHHIKGYRRSLASTMFSSTPADPLQPKLFSADLDGTLIGNPEATQRFKAAWERLDSVARPLLVYNSGRLVENLRRLIDDGTLPKAGFYIGGVGTQVYDAKAKCMLDELKNHFAHSWDLHRVLEVTGQFPGTRPQPVEYQHEFKSSWFLDKASPGIIRKLKRQLAEAGLKIEVCYSSSRDLDVLPQNATKGSTLKWLCERLGIPLDTVIVAGDTGNDSSMFRLPGVRGIIPKNALPELFKATIDVPTYRSRQIIADGVLDGLCHYGVICTLPTKEQP